MKNGIDVSQHQGNIDWSAVKTDFAIIRAGYGKVKTQIDTQFERNYNGAKAAGIPVGAYWYSYATSVEEAILEAEAFLHTLEGKIFEYPVYLDIEEKATLNLGCNKVSDIVTTFLNYMEKAGYFAGLYMSASPLTQFTTQFVKNRYAIWVAHYGVSKPSYSGQYGMWQKSSTGRVSGINGNVDLDECYVDYPYEIKKAGRNGFKAPTSEPVKPTPKTINVEMTVDGVKYAGTLTEKK